MLVLTAVMISGFNVDFSCFMTSTLRSVQYGFGGGVAHYGSTVPPVAAIMPSLAAEVRSP